MMAKKFKDERMENSQLDQIPFQMDDFADNPEPRCPCLLLLDTSGSMSGMPIKQLNEALIAFKDELSNDSLAAKRVEISVVTFGPVETKCDFHTAPQFFPPQLEASGDTPMGAAIIEGLRLIQVRKEEYKANGISFYRPWIFLITDGAPTDSWSEAAVQVKDGESKKKFAFFPVGVEGANMDILGKISVREPLKLQGLKFREFFLWLSASMKAVSRSAPDAILQIAAPSGWAEV